MKRLLAVFLLCTSSSFALGQRPPSIESLAFEPEDGVSLCDPVRDDKMLIRETSASYYCDPDASPDPVWRRAARGVIDFNVRDYGAKGDDATDDTAAVQSAIAAATAVNGIVYVPQGTYLVTSPLTVTNQPVHFVGEGKSGVSTIKASGSLGAGEGVVDFDDVSTNNRTSFQYLDIQANGADYGVRSAKLAHVTFRGVRVSGATVAGVYIENGWSNVFDDFEASSNTGDGIKLKDNINGTVVTNSQLFANNGWGVHVVSGRDFVVENTGVEVNAKGGVFVEYTNSMSLVDNYFEGNGSAGFTDWTTPVGLGTVRADVVVNGGPVADAPSKSFPCWGFKASGNFHSLYNGNHTAYWLGSVEGAEISGNSVNSSVESSWVNLIEVYVDIAYTEARGVNVVGNSLRQCFGDPCSVDDTLEDERLVLISNPNEGSWNTFSTWTIGSNSAYHWDRDSSEADAPKFFMPSEANYFPEDVREWTMVAAGSGGSAPILDRSEKFNGQEVVLFTGNDIWGTSINVDDYPELQGALVWFGAWVKHESPHDFVSLNADTPSGAPFVNTGSTTTHDDWYWQELLVEMEASGVHWFGFRSQAVDEEVHVALPTVVRLGASRKDVHGDRGASSGWVDVRSFGALGDGADDAVAVQAAIDAVGAAGGGRVYFPPGDYAASSTLTVDSPNVELYFDGATMTLDDVGSGIKVRASDVTIMGRGALLQASKDLAVEANDYELISVEDSLGALENIHVRDLKLRVTVTNGAVGLSPLVAAVRFDGLNTGNGVYGVSVEGCDVKVSGTDVDQEHKYYGLYAYSFSGDVGDNTKLVHNVAFRRNYLDGSAGRNIQMFNVDGGVVSDNIIDNLSSSNVFGANGIRILDSSDVQITGNTVRKGPNGKGTLAYFGMGSGFTTPPGCRRCNLVGNTLVDASAHNGTSVYADGVRDMLISDNVIQATDPTGLASHFGIRIDDAVNASFSNEDVVIKGNKIKGYGGSAGFAVRVDPNQTSVSILENYLGSGVSNGNFISDLFGSTLKSCNVHDGSLQDCGGDRVVGPGSSTDNAVARFDGTTGKLVQNSSVTIDDDGDVTARSLVASLTGSGLAIDATRDDTTSVTVRIGNTAPTTDTDIVDVFANSIASVAKGANIRFIARDEASGVKELATISAQMEQSWTATAADNDSRLVLRTTKDGTPSDRVVVDSEGVTQVDSLRLGPDRDGRYVNWRWNDVDDRFEIVADASFGYDQAWGLTATDIFAVLDNVGQKFKLPKEFTAENGGAFQGTVFFNNEVQTSGTLGVKVASNITANGSTVAAATLLACQHCEVRTVSSSSKGIKLQACNSVSSTAGLFQKVINADRDDTAWLFANVASGTVRADESGSHEGINNTLTLQDSSKSWATNELAGAAISNVTDGSSGSVTSNTGSSAVTTLSGGIDADWDVGDLYTIDFTGIPLFLPPLTVADCICWGSNTWAVTLTPLER